MGAHEITEDLILGGLSCVFWTLTLITTFKYVYLALSADNKGEGGIFALYALVRRYKSRWVIYPAVIGCATLISDGFITPAISVTSAIEGLRANQLTIDAQQGSRVFNIDDGDNTAHQNVTISGLTITGGEIGDDGAGNRSR
mgnify:CR=1 FL=1